jgi:Zn-finger nucleic acid-binding protein
MICPQCQADMVEGVAQVRGTFTGYLLFGYSCQDLYFDRNKKTSLILSSREKSSSFQCPKCSGVFISSLSVQPRFEIDLDTGVVTEYTEDNENKGV